MPQQKGVKRAAKVAVRQKKVKARRKEANLKKLAHAHAGHDHDQKEKVAE